MVNVGGSGVVSDNIDIFDESDWDFFDSSDDLELFGDYEDDIVLHEHTAMYKTVTYFGIGVFSTILVGAGVYCFDSIVLERLRPAGESVIYSSNKLTRVDGNAVSSAVEVSINKLVSNYFGVLSGNLDLSELNGYCLDGSSVYSLEEKYRQESKYSYDSNDCYSRAIKAFSSYISLSRVTSVVEKDGVFFVYVDVTIPDVNELSEYYNKGSADMSFYFKSNAITSINISKYMLKTLSNKDLPVRTTELQFEVIDVDDVLVIRSDSALQSYCTEPYINSISSIVDILGGQLLS